MLLLCLDFFYGGRLFYDIFSGIVQLFVDFNWNSLSMSLWIDDDDINIVGVEYSFVGIWMDNLLLWVVFNFFVDVVVMLIEYLVLCDNVVNVVGCGRIVDLVGIGEIQGVNFMFCGFNDIMLVWFWWKVDLDLGVIEFYEYFGYIGSCIVIFLFDWLFGKIYFMGGWFMDNFSSFVKWYMLDDCVICIIWKDEGFGDRKVLVEFNKICQFDDLY